MNAELKPLNLSENNFMIISKLFNHPGVSQIELNRLIYRNHSIISKQIKRLQNMGYVEMKVDPANKTKRQLFLTDKGIAVNSKVQLIQASVNHWIVAELSESDRENFENILKQIFSNKNTEIQDILLS
ncbi:hypothetical protein FC83_GL003274 [Agrilactobacillus composti DSM 18527 = JCM 14202]|uniref:HTH marR-type domain-containing protein n=1 Tax=Agrilactobacillus composti DSM 18527 = JCM 14202 TaxID=1423734 RepID=X0QIK1_9LACO|nr:hypothetical protein FC83_GL003274 [Agrilactobacillus composti DSM 18527 = JCM 14202]GAF38435.1 hypothetical protein JCM14202_243 [Agrilactobacillus composti DSM 18527 = JCM 14202]